MTPRVGDESLSLLLDATRRFLTRHVNAAAIEDGGCMPEPVVSAAAGAGLFGLTIPAAWGGLELPLEDACAVVAELARVDRSVAIMVGLHAGLGSWALVHHGTPAQRARWLPAMAAGDCVASFAATEPGAGSDLQAITTTAEVMGDTLRIHGEKSYVTNGGFAGIYTVLSRTPGLGGARASSLVCVPRGTPGLSVGAEEHKLGIRASSTVALHFDDARVPVEHILGSPGAGHELTYGSLERGRVIMAAGCVGTGRFALDAAVAHVATRRQFRRPIGDFDGVRLQVATMRATEAAMDALVTAAARALDGGHADAARLSVAAKVYGSEGAWALCDAAVQLHGAMGFLEPVGVARALRDCRVTRIFEGANDVLLAHLGASLLAQSGVAEASSSENDVDALQRRLDATIAAHRAAQGVRATQRQLLTQRLGRASVCVLAARAMRASGRCDDATARFAEELLMRDGHRALDALRTLDADERAARELGAPDASSTRRSL